MFTGLIDHCGIVQAIEKNKDSIRLSIQTSFTDLVLGESIAVDGACLTVTSFQDGIFTCDISPETEKLTIVKNYQKGTKVNLERALCLSDRLGGHFVMGHVDQMGEIIGKVLHAEYVELLIDVHEKKYLVPKGSIAINGVSLTINAITDTTIQLMLIPLTLAKTNLSHLSVGDYVNIEFDWLSKLMRSQFESISPTYF